MNEEITIDTITEIEEIKEADINAAKVSELRTVPGYGGTFGANGLSAEDLKKRFDALPMLLVEKTKEIINAYNALVAAAIAIDDKADGIADELYAEATKREEGLAEEATARGKAIADEAQAREKAVSEEAQARDSAVKAESVARAAAIAALKDDLLGGASDAYDTLKELEDALTNGESEVIAILAKISAVEASLADKVNTTDVSATATPNTIAKRGASGRLAVGRAAADSDAVPYKQMREELERYLADGGGLPPDLLDGITNAIKAIDTLEAKVANLEAGLAPEMFTVDDTTAYVKTIPTDAKPYAQILAVGGMTHKVEQLGENLFNPLVVSGYEGEVSAEADGTIYMDRWCFGWGARFYDLFPDIVVGNKYIFSASASGGDLQPASIEVGGIPLDTPFTLTEEQYSIYIQLNNGLADDGAAGQPVGGTFYISLYEYSGELIDAKVTALDILGKNLFDEKSVTGTINGGGAFENAATITDEYVSVKIGSYMSSIFLTPFAFFLQEGKAVTISADVFIPTGGAPTLNVSLGIGNPLENIAKSIRYPILSTYDEWQRVSASVNAKKTGWHFLLLQGYGNSSNFRNLDVRFKNIKVATGTTDTTYSPYRKTTFAIPAEVQALDGYGKTGYGIEWDDDGKPWWVTPDARTDISQYFTEDNFIPVEGGGTITAVNAEGLAAPTTIVYQKRGN